MGSIYVSGKLTTYPFPNPTFCPKWEVSDNVGLGEGGVGGRARWVVSHKHKLINWMYLKRSLQFFPSLFCGFSPAHFCTSRFLFSLLCTELLTWASLLDFSAILHGFPLTPLTGLFTSQRNLEQWPISAQKCWCLSSFYLSLAVVQRSLIGCH